jgi:hypothetical protein
MKCRERVIEAHEEDEWIWLKALLDHMDFSRLSLRWRRYVYRRLLYLATRQHEGERETTCRVVDAWLVTVSIEGLFL